MIQTFLPYPDYLESAKVLDNRRLGKQRLEVLQIVHTLFGFSKGWINHPATRMWVQTPDSLIIYGLCICNEWIRRGFRDTIYDRLRLLLSQTNPSYPSWLGGPIHPSHRSNLLRKDYNHYNQFGWTEPLNLAYIWPI